MPCENCACNAPPSKDASCSAVPLKNSRPLQKKSSSDKIWTLQAPQESATGRSPSPSGRQDREEQLQEILGDVQPLAHKCGVDGREDMKCCKELKGDDERHLISPEIVRDVVIGLSDGLTVPFALTAGLSGLGSSKLVVTAGLAELFAGAISMGLGGYLASQAELDHFHYLRKQTTARVLRSCAGEMEREVHAILGPLGVKEPLSRLVAADLREVEDAQHGRGIVSYGTVSEGVSRPRAVSTGEESGASGASGASGSKKERLSLFWRKKKDQSQNENSAEQGGEAAKADNEMGLTAFLLKFGEGMEEVPRSRLWISALTIGMSYFIGGLIPLIPYMANGSAQEALIISCCVTGVILFLFGGFKTYFTGAAGGIGGYLYGATSMLIVGGIAAGAAYGLVKALGVHE